MRIFISTDMEGVSGTVSRQEVLQGMDEFFFRAGRRLTQEVNAAIEGAIEGGASEFRVCDSHGEQLNIFYEEIHPEAELVRGTRESHRKFVIMDGLDDSFDLLFLVGYHAAASVQDGVLSHTWSGSGFAEVHLNGELLSEARLGTYLAANLGLPLGLIVGDKAICDEVKQWAPWAKRVVTKTGLSKNLAICAPLAKNLSSIRTTAKQAVESFADFKLIEPPEKSVLRIEMTNSVFAERCGMIPGIEWDGNRTVTSEPMEFPTLFNVFRAMVYLAR